jgi:hypothetical protein
VTVNILVDAIVVVSVVLSLAVAPRVLSRSLGPNGAPSRRSISPLVPLALVTAMVYLNQILFTVYVLRVHGGDASFVARYLPTGWFELATNQGALRDLAGAFPVPGLLAPSVLRVQAFLELPFVLLAFATVVRWLDTGLYRRIARSALLPLASVSYTAVFCLVEWDLRNPYTIEDIVVRAVSAIVTPLLIRRLADHDTGSSRTPASVTGLLVFIGSLGALGVLVLVVYDTALLYNLGRLDNRFLPACVAVSALACLRRIASRLPAPPSPGPTLTFVRLALLYWLALFFAPALAIRYGVMFGNPQLAAVGAMSTAVLACAFAGRNTLAGARPAADSTSTGAGTPAHSEADTRSDARQRRWSALVLAEKVSCAVLAGAGASYLVARVTPDSYYEVTLLSAAATFLVTGVVVSGLVDARTGTRAGRLTNGSGRGGR